MASINYILFAVLIITPFVQNAPCPAKSTKEDELHTRLVFLDNDDNAIVSNSRVVFDSAATHQLKQETKNKSTTSKLLAEQVSTNPETLVHDNKSNSKMDDERRIWGIIVEEKDLPEDESYYNRPLSIPRNINTNIIVPKNRVKFN